MSDRDPCLHPQVGDIFDFQETGLAPSRITILATVGPGDCLIAYKNHRGQVEWIDLQAWQKISAKHCIGGQTAK